MSLGHLLQRAGPAGFDGCAAWGQQLSPGELQRLAVARLLHARPALALLDEPTSALGAEGAAQLYAALHSAGVTCLSVGQDLPHLRALHRRLLLVLGAVAGGGSGAPRGAWRLVEIDGRAGGGAGVA